MIKLTNKFRFNCLFEWLHFTSAWSCVCFLFDSISNYLEVFIFHIFTTQNLSLWLLNVLLWNGFPVCFLLHQVKPGILIWCNPPSGSYITCSFSPVATTHLIFGVASLDVENKRISCFTTSCTCMCVVCTRKSI